MTNYLKFAPVLLLTFPVVLGGCQNPAKEHGRYGAPNFTPYGYYDGQPGSGQYGQYPQAQSLPALRPSINVNYDITSALEAPIGYNIAGATLALRGQIDAPLAYSLDDDDGNLDQSVITNHEFSLERQLPNRITVGAVYGGRFENVPGENNNYDDNFAVFAGGSWGTFFGGNVSDLVREETRRARNAGFIELAGDGASGRVENTSGGYRGRFGPAIVSGLIDENANYDVGVSFQRPIGVKDYRFTARHNNGTLLAADGLTRLDTRSVSGTAEYVFGSLRMDVQTGYESIEDADRWFTSAGVAKKAGAWTVSAEGKFGQTDGRDETAALVTLRRDLARGVSATVALDHRDLQTPLDATEFIDDKDTRILAALTYGF